jgi:2-amino-4-hydroxy-6-hydroxymethyldihydropteridine diphosphokinase
VAAIAYIGLGGNLKHPRRQLARALAELEHVPRTCLITVSHNYLSAPLECSETQPDYVNAVAALHTALSPRALLARLRVIERRHGRRRRDERNAPRTLDLDLLLFGRRRVADHALTIPHPRMHERAFVLVPLREIAPAVTIPGRGLARRWLRRVHGQRIVRTRTHAWR